MKLEGAFFGRKEQTKILRKNFLKRIFREKTDRRRSQRKRGPFSASLGTKFEGYSGFSEARI